MSIVILCLGILSKLACKFFILISSIFDSHPYDNTKGVKVARGMIRWSIFQGMQGKTRTHKPGLELGLGKVTRMKKLAKISEVVEEVEVGL